MPGFWTTWYFPAVMPNERASLDFHLPSLKLFLKDGIWRDSCWLLLDTLAWAPHFIPGRKENWQSAPFEDGRGRKGTNIYYHTKCHIPNLRWAAFILLISAILNQPGKWKSFISSFYYFFNRWENRFREEVKWLAWGRLAEPRLELWSAWLGSPALFHSAILPALLPHSI